MIFKLFFFNLSVFIFSTVLVYDFELFCLTIFLLFWHLLKGITNILNDYIYSKALQLSFCFLLQITVFEILLGILNFLF